MSERLSAFESQTSTGQVNSEQKQQSLAADSLVTLLTQGLQSSDSTLLDVSISFLNTILILIYFSPNDYYMKQYKQRETKRDRRQETTEKMNTLKKNLFSRL